MGGNEVNNDHKRTIFNLGGRQVPKEYLLLLSTAEIILQFILLGIRWMVGSCFVFISPVCVAVKYTVCVDSLSPRLQRFSVGTDHETSCGL